MSISTAISLNFGFLHSHDSLLDVYAARAERYVFDDPNTSVIKLRQFAELLARHVAAFHGIETTDEDFRRTLAIIRDKRLATREVAELFDLLRLKGNEAVHEGANDRRTALAGLITAHKLSGWFQQTFVDPAFHLTPFKPPPNPSDVATSLREELDSLRDEAARYQQQLAEVRGEASQLQRVKEELERQAEDAQRQLVARELDLAGAEKVHQQEKEAYERQLRQLAAQSLERPPAMLASFVERSQRAARQIGLDRHESQHVPLAQIRIRGPSVSRCHNAPTLLVQHSTGGGVTANCSVCGRWRPVQGDEFFKLDLWVSCPNCRQRMGATMIGNNYGFRCEKCLWSCWLASLLPGENDLL